MQPLMLHRTCDLGPIRAVLAGIEASATGCTVRFRLEGRIDAIRLAEPRPSSRADDLWRTTCCEVFWQPIGGSAYREFNFSPSSEWAAYHFERYREGRADAAVDAISVVSRANAEALELTATIAAPMSDPAQVGLSAVIEHTDGVLQYWALAFGPGKPDFHSEACRQLIVEAV